MKKGLLWVLLALCTLTGCQKAPEPVEATTFAMDTVMDFTLYGDWDRERAKEVRDWMLERLGWLDGKLSATKEGSDVGQINRAGGESVEVGTPTAELLSQSLELCRLVGGALDITAYPAVKAWGFTREEHRVPAPDELEALAQSIDYSAVRLEGDTVTLPEGMELDLGAVAKGWTGDRLMELFREAGAASAIVELGGNVQALGARPDGSPWRVAVQAPEGGYAGALEIADKAVITSGGYQRYFEQDGVTYCHIIDPATGRPARTGLASVTIVADRGVRGDGLSTALFVMGRERAEAYWREHPGFDFILLGEDGTAAITEGLEDCFSLCGAWEDRPLEIIRK